MSNIGTWVLIGLLIIAALVLITIATTDAQAQTADCYQQPIYCTAPQYCYRPVYCYTPEGRRYVCGSQRYVCGTNRYQCGTRTICQDEPEVSAPQTYNAKRIRERNHRLHEARRQARMQAYLEKWKCKQPYSVYQRSTYIERDLAAAGYYRNESGCYTNKP